MIQCSRRRIYRIYIYTCSSTNNASGSVSPSALVGAVPWNTQRAPPRTAVQPSARERRRHFTSIFDGLLQAPAATFVLAATGYKSASRPPFSASPSSDTSLRTSLSVRYDGQDDPSYAHWRIFAGARLTDITAPSVDNIDKDARFKLAF